LLGLHFHPEDGSRIFTGNVNKLVPCYKFSLKPKLRVFPISGNNFWARKYGSTFYLRRTALEKRRSKRKLSVSPQAG
jgi:hypothetical protein